jgi:hypothetical protein
VAEAGAMTRSTMQVEPFHSLFIAALPFAA